MNTADKDALHAAIMNLPCDPVALAILASNRERIVYAEAHRDARHAAAELVAVHPAEMMEVQNSETAHLMAPVGSDLQAADAQGEGPCCDDDGCPTELAVLQRFWRGQPVPPEREPPWFKAIPKINQPPQE